MKITIKRIGFKSGEMFHWIKNLYLRYRYGGGCCDIFGLDFYLAKKIIRPLKRFREKNNVSYPCDENIKSHEDWMKILDEMIWAFEYIISGEEPVYTNGNYDIEESKKLYKREQNGLELFGKYFRSLWI